MLVADPTYHAECEWFAGRACAAIAIEQCDDLIVIVHGDAVWRQVQLDRFGCAALPSNMQSQQLWLRALDACDMTSVTKRAILKYSPSARPIHDVASTLYQRDDPISGREPAGTRRHRLRAR
jgi:hypothetical protein